MRNSYTLGICLFLLISGVGWAQQQSQQGKQPAQTKTPATAAKSSTAAHQLVITPEEKALKNPVKFTEESATKGKALYMTQCAMCHAKNGDGKGDLAAVMHVNPPDFTKPAILANRTDGELFTIIQKGTGSMPAEGTRLRQDQAWNLVNFLRTLEGKTPVKSAKTRAGRTHH